MYVCMYVRMYVCMYVCVYNELYVCISVYIGGAACMSSAECP